MMMSFIKAFFLMGGSTVASEWCGSNQPFRLNYLGSNARTCLQAVEFEAKSRCVDVADWFDGTNGCAAYRAHEEAGDGWCATYGFMGANVNCCACGGGNGDDEAFAVGDAVEVAKGQKWTPATVARVDPAPGFKYDVQSGKMRLRVRLEASVRQLQRDAYDGAELRACGEDQLWDNEMRSGNMSLWSNGDKHTTLSKEASNVVLEQALGESWPNVVTVRSETVCLVGGRFAQAEFTKPQWMRCSDPMVKHLPVALWEVDCGDSDETTVERLKGMLTQNGVAPWTVLGVSRGASAKTVKAAFRDVSRLLHPDKRRLHFFDEDEASLDALFARAHAAYEELGRKDDAQKERFRIDNEVQERLFAADGSSVVELDESNFRNGSLNTSQPGVHVIIMYSPQCSMSRAIAPLVRLAARLGDVRYAAIACAPEAKRFADAFKDPICQSIEPGFDETPRIVAMVDDPSPKAASWRLSYESVRADNLTVKLGEFGRRAERLWQLANLVEVYTDDVPDLVNSTRVVVVLGGDSRLTRDIESFAASVVPTLRQVDARLFVRKTDQEPSILVYGKGKTTGIPLVPEALSDLRDAQIALTSLTATLRALADDDDLYPVDEFFTAEEEEKEEEKRSCSGGSPPPPLGEHPELDKPDQAVIDQPPEQRPQEAKLAPRKQSNSRRRAAGRTYGSASGGRLGGGSSTFALGGGGRG